MPSFSTFSFHIMRYLTRLCSIFKFDYDENFSQATTTGKISSQILAEGIPIVSWKVTVITVKHVKSDFLNGIHSISASFFQKETHLPFGIEVWYSPSAHHIGDMRLLVGPYICNI